MRFLTGLFLIPLLCAQAPARQEILGAMRKSAAFYRQKVSTEGGYHYYYAADLSFGRSEHSQGPTQVEVQREATPIVALAYLKAWDATGEKEYLDYARDAALALVRGQLCSGGWDYSIEFDPEKRKEHQYRSDNNCGADRRGVTNLDDNTTQGALRVLMRVDQELKFSDARIHEAARYALDKLVAAQYPIGAWPQRFKSTPDHSRFPVKRASYPESWPRQWPGPDYQGHYTFNDNTLADCIDLMLEASQIYNEPRYRAAAEKGGQFVLLAQMPDPQPAWAQQYDRDMHPVWARVFEPPSITGGESQGAIRILMTLYRETGDKKYLAPIPKALDYLKGSFVPLADAEIFRRVGQGPVLARFYELKTNKPLYVTKGSRVSAAELGSRLVDGYQLSYTPESVSTHYAVLVSGRELASIEDEYRTLAAGNAGSMRRTGKLRSLSPWSERQRGGGAASPAEIQKVLVSMDERGAWTKDGVIGKADRLAFVYAAKNMVVRIGRGQADGSAGGGAGATSQVIQLKENDTVEVFLGDQPPREKIISSADFAKNLSILISALR